ncbi:MAG: mechanosensitive ion channel [Succinivibrio sp.]|nr:mechanosensitive ion channel [Succinivibrio sp.]
MLWGVFCGLAVLQVQAAPSAAGAAAESEVLITAAEINEALGNLETGKLEAADKEKLQRQLKNGLSILTKLDESVQHLTRLHDFAAHSQSELQSLHSNYVKAARDFTKLPNTEKLTGEKLERELKQVQEDSEQAQAELKQAYIEFNRLQALPGRAQAQILKNNLQIEKSQLDNAEPQNTELADKLKALNIAFLHKQNEEIQFELAERMTLLDVAEYKIRIASLKSDYYQKLLIKLQEQHNLEISRQIEQEVMALQLVKNYSSDLDQREDKELEKLKDLKRLLEFNSSMVNSLTDQLKYNLKLTQQQQKVDLALSMLEQSKSNLDSLLEGMDSSILLSRSLNRQYSKIEEIRLEEIDLESITDVNLKLFDIRFFRNELFDLDGYVDKLIGQHPRLALMRGDLIKILQYSKQLIDQLNEQFSITLANQISLKIRYGEYQRMRTDLENKITENMFYLRSNQTFGSNFLSFLWPSLRNSFYNFTSRWQDKENWTATLHTLLLMVVPALLIFGGFKLGLEQKLTAIDHKLVKRLDGPDDNLWVTPLSFGIQVLLSLPRVMLWFVLGAVLICLSNVAPALQIEVICMLIIHIFVFVLFLALLRPDSFAQSHLKISKTELNANHKLLSKVWCAMIPLLVVGNVTEKDASEIYFNVIGHLIMLIASLYLFVILLGWIKNQLKREDRFSVIQWGATLGCTVSLLLIIGMLLSGYFYTTVKLINRFAYTVYFGAFFWISTQLLKRAVYVVQNKVKNRQWLNEQAEHAEPQGNARPKVRRKSYELVILDYLGTKIFSLLRIALLCITLYLMYCQWDDLAGVLNYFNTVKLWTRTEMVNDTEVVVSTLTLGSVIWALIILCFTVYLSKNVPSLLERLLTIRRKQDNSTGYTAKIISSYAIMAVGIIWASGILGLAWSHMQWLVAALSVGLGFGLQEIFANFVSGVIILFERQLRVGDVITLANLSGTVLKIRIRATTILSFENKEVMIPNKQFITGALTNWSLSNTITRLEYVIYLAFDADVEKAKEIIREVAHSCPYVVKSKPALVYISSVSSQRVEIKCEVEVSEIGKRKLTFDYLNEELLKYFAEHQIKFGSPEILRAH